VFRWVAFYKLWTTVLDLRNGKTDLLALIGKARGEPVYDDLDYLWSQNHLLGDAEEATPDELLVSTFLRDVVGLKFYEDIDAGHRTKIYLTCVCYVKMGKEDNYTSLVRNNLSDFVYRKNLYIFKTTTRRMKDMTLATWSMLTTKHRNLALDFWSLAIAWTPTRSLVGTYRLGNLLCPNSYKTKQCYHLGER